MRGFIKSIFEDTIYYEAAHGDAYLSIEESGRKWDWTVGYDGEEVGKGTASTPDEAATAARAHAFKVAAQLNALANG